MQSMGQDTFVIFHSDEDGCWIAHSLRMDQIGTGDGVMAALGDGIKATHQVAQLVAEDPTIALLRDAPDDIQDMARRATSARREVYEIAFKMAHDQWPDDLEPDITPRDQDRPLVVREEVMALAQ
jgi:hypothetical protein